MNAIRLFTGQCGYDLLIPAAEWYKQLGISCDFREASRMPLEAEVNNALFPGTRERCCSMKRVVMLALVLAVPSVVIAGTIRTAAVVTMPT